MGTGEIKTREIRRSDRNPVARLPVVDAPERVICAAFSSVIWPIGFTVMPE
jgi:hypothetical protein